MFKIIIIYIILIEFMNTPMKSLSINNENLILSNQNEKQNLNINHFTIEKNCQLSEEFNIYIIKCNNFGIYVYLYNAYIFFF